jgi:hypothetical protein
LWWRLPLENRDALEPRRQDAGRREPTNAAADDNRVIPHLLLHIVMLLRYFVT